MHIRFLLTLFSFLFFTEGDPPAGDPPKGDPPEPKPDEVTFDEKQQAKLNALLAAERKKTEEATAARLKQEQADAKAKADADAERKRQEAAGEFDQVKQSLTTERDTALDEAKTLKATNDALLALVTADVDAAWGDLPDEVREAYDGPDDDPLAKKQHMTRMAKVIARLTAEAAKPGNGPNPPAAGPRELNVAEEAAKARARGGYRI